MQLLFYILIFFLLSALPDYAELVYLWQLKEYRLDRFRDFLSSVLGRKFLLSYKIIFRPLVFLLLIFSLRTVSVLFIIFSLDILNSAYKLARRRLPRPKFTAKAISLIIFSVIIETVIFSSNLPFFWLLAASRFLILALAVLAVNLPTKLLKKFYLRRAAIKLAGYKNLLVIGVTGSYGKTTVKNFLAQMLSAKFKVVAPPKNINTELGIAKFILKTDFFGADIFVVEMAAYKIWEIKLICNMVRPKIGILTAINEQHLPLFGSIENTQTAKYELLRALPADGLAVINSDNQYCREFTIELKCQVKTFGQSVEVKPDYLISQVRASLNGLEFSAAPDYEIKTKIIGAHNAMNVAPTIIISEYLGLTKADIIKQALKLRLPEATMQLTDYGSSVIIDDSYNSNPEAFKAALKYLADSKTAGKKIVISRGMIELGEASRAAHEEIGKLIAEVADELVIISPDSTAEFRAGAGDSKLKIQTIFEPISLLEYVKKNKNRPNLILLEGRLPEIIKKEIK